jgi:hypothetical protein
VGHYLVVSSNDALLRRVALTHDGAERPVSQLPQYAEARNALPSDANLMVFVSPQAMSNAGKAAGTDVVKSAKWMCFGAAIRDNGIRVDFRSPLEKAMVPPAGAGFLEPNFLGKLPSGALGIVAIADPGNSIQWMQKGFAKEQGVAEGIKDFEKEAGLSISRDIVPAFSGSLVLGVYPGASSEPADVDGLLMLDSNNGANPAALATKLRLKFEADTAKDPKPLRFVRSEYGGAEVWSADPAVTKEIASSTKEMGIGARAPYFALINKAVLMASSKHMLFTAIRAYRGASSLANDPPFAQMQQQMGERSQVATLVSLNRVLNRMRSLFDGKSDMSLPVDDLVQVFGGENDGLVISGYVQGNQMIGSAFLPLDYDRAARASKSMSSKVSLATAEPART